MNEPDRTRLPDSFPNVVRLLAALTPHAVSTWPTTIGELGYQEVNTLKLDGGGRKDYHTDGHPDLHFYVEGETLTSASSVLALSSSDCSLDSQLDTDKNILHFDQVFHQAVQTMADILGPPDLNTSWDSENYPLDTGADRIAIWHLSMQRLLKLELCYGTDTAPFALQIWLDLA